MKFLIWGVVLALVILWLMRPKALRSPGKQARPAADAPEAMLQCAECHTYFPASEALSAANGAVFCCDQHRRLHASR
jgi:uncharacterized protein